MRRVLLLAQLAVGLSPAKDGLYTRVPMFMPGVTTSEEDTYMCIAQKMPSKHPVYLVGTDRVFEGTNVHHTLLYSCQCDMNRLGKHIDVGGRYGPGSMWQCKGHSTCPAGCQSSLMHGSPVTGLDMFPEGTAFAVGGASAGSLLTLQVHYKKIVKDDHSGMFLLISQKPPEFKLGLIAWLLGGGTLPAHRCTVNQPMTALAFRVHAHGQGSHIWGAYRRKGSKEVNLLGSRSPKQPQIFNQIEPVRLEIGDQVVAACEYDTSRSSQDTSIGANAGDEMCNFYLLYYSDGDTRNGMCVASSEAKRELATSYKDDPNRRTAEWLFSQMESSNVKYSVVNLDHSPAKLQCKKCPEREEGIGNPPVDGTGVQEVKMGGGMELISTFAIRGGPHRSQISGVSLNEKEMTLWVFHRGSRYWRRDSFGDNGVVQHTDYISEPTVLCVDPGSGEILRSFGQNLMMMPHSILVEPDSMGATAFIWLTDVGLHQVLKLDAVTGEVVLRLGEEKVPGKTQARLCKPSGVALYRGNVYVSDGYCNNRVVVFDQNGQYSNQWVFPTANIVHAIVFDHKRGNALVADRENHQVLIVDPKTGSVNKVIGRGNFAGVYDISVQADTDTAIVLHSEPDALHGLVRKINLKTYEPVETFGSIPRENALSLQYSHTITSTDCGCATFVAELVPPRVRLFTTQDGLKEGYGSGKNINKLGSKGKGTETAAFVGGNSPSTGNKEVTQPQPTNKALSPKKVDNNVEGEMEERERVKNSDTSQEQVSDSIDVDIQVIKIDKSRFWALDPVVLALSGILLIVVCVGGKTVWQRRHGSSRETEWSLLPTRADSPTDQILRFRLATGKDSQTGLNFHSITRGGRDDDEGSDGEKEMNELRLLDSGSDDE